MSNLVPEGWNPVKLSMLSEHITKGATPTTYGFGWEKSGIVFLRSECVKDSKFSLSGSEYISAEAHKSMKRSAIRGGDLLVSITGYIGQACILPMYIHEANMNQHIARIRVKDKDQAKYIMYHLNSEPQQREFRNIQTGQAYPQLSLKQIQDIEICFPPLPELQKIAAILTSVDEVIEKTQAQIDKLKDLKTAMMQELLLPSESGGVGTKPASADAALNNRTACRESYIPHTEFKDSPVGRIPKSWEVVTLRDVVIAKGLQTGPFGSQLHAHEYVENGVPVVMPKNMKSNRVSCKGIAQITAEKAATLSKHKVLSGDILFSRRGDIGRFALVEDVNEGSICGTGCLKARLNDSMSSSFFAAYLTLEYVVEWLINNSVGQTMLNLNTSILAALPVLKPPLEEQNKISSVITSIDMSITLKERKLLAQQNTKKALMQDLLTGKVRVKVD